MLGLVLIICGTGLLLHQKRLEVHLAGTEAAYQQLQERHRLLTREHLLSLELSRASPDFHKVLAIIERRDGAEIRSSSLDVTRINNLRDIRIE